MHPNVLYIFAYYLTKESLSSPKRTMYSAMYAKKSNNTLTIKCSYPEVDTKAELADSPFSPATYAVLLVTLHCPSAPLPSSRVSSD